MSMERKNIMYEYFPILECLWQPGALTAIRKYRIKKKFGKVRLIKRQKMQWYDCTYHIE